MLGLVVAFLVALTNAKTQLDSQGTSVYKAGWIKQSITPSVLTVILTFLVFLLILAFALRNLMGIKTPVQFADKSLVLNKEY